MTPTMWWRLVMVIALAATAWYVVHLIRENAQQDDAIRSLTSGINTLNQRANDLQAAQIANDAADTQTRDQATQGVSRNETARRTDRDTIAIDQPYPAAMRHRVFLDPDPASGSTAAVDDPAAGDRRRKVQKP